jgi:glycosyltransferase involved in cell wall biosynthesis
MRPKISLVMPTRERPKWVERYFQSVVDHTSNLENVEVVLYIDDDDSTSKDLDCNQFRVVKIIGPRLTMGAYNTICMKKSEGDIIVLQNDDMVIRTDGWDEILLNFHNQYDDGIYLAYPNDLYMKEKLSVAPVISRRTCELLGDPFPEPYLGGFIDYHIFDIFIRLKRLGFDRFCFIENLIIEHLHYRFGKSEYDKTYENRGHLDRGDEVFVELRNVRQEAAQCLVSAINQQPLVPISAIPPIPNPPSGIRFALMEYARAFLFDKGLPVKWRLEMFKLFLGRYLAKRYKKIDGDKMMSWRLTLLEYFNDCLNGVSKPFR